MYLSACAVLHNICIDMGDNGFHQGDNPVNNVIRVQQPAAQQARLGTQFRERIVQNHFA